MEERFDYLVIGAGIAGLSFALDAAESGGTVAVLAKRERSESNTYYAQGGIASVWSESDSYDDHIRDTHRAGAGICEREAVEITVKEGPEQVRRLIERGVEFSRRGAEAAGGGADEYDLGREGGHSHRRVLHHKDMTGAEVARVLLERAAEHPNITLKEHYLAVELITRGRLRSRKPIAPSEDRCLGVYALDVEAGLVHVMLARTTLLATGGAGKVYLYTSNPDVATGDGLAMAFRAGAKVANMEFFQFHPTCLYHPQAKSFLISEALRGEGGRLLRADGHAFMPQYHPMADLAPRDIVARAIDNELKSSGDDCAYLDMTHHSGAFLRDRFPTIYERCAELGIDMATQPIPIVPAAHYQCGGVVTDMCGETNVPSLFAVGEVAYTGLHGANRLASNSLLEALVFARRAAQRARDRLAEAQEEFTPDVPPWSVGFARAADEAVLVSQAWDEIRRMMWNYVGIVRSNQRLDRAKRRIELAEMEIREDYWRFTLTQDLVELRNLATVAHLIVDSARVRQESRGLHYNVDYPETDDANWKRPTVLWRGARG